MKRMRVLMPILFLFIFAVTPGTHAAKEKDTWEDITSNIGESDIKTIAMDPADSHTVYLGSTKNIFKTRSSGEKWKNIFTVKGSLTHVNAIAIDQVKPNKIYAATQNGLFKSNNWGKNWRRLFRGVGNLQKDTRCILLDPKDSDTIYIGTRDGLFISKNAGSSWAKAAGEISNVQINYITSNPDSIFVAAASGVFKSTDSGKNLQKIFTTVAGT